MTEQDSTVIQTDSDHPESVTETPLEGLETEVLKVWLQTPKVRKAHQANPTMVEQAVRRAVFDALAEEARLRAEGKAPHEAQEFTRPQMWQAPAFRGA